MSNDYERNDFNTYGKDVGERARGCGIGLLGLLAISGGFFLAAGAYQLTGEDGIANFIVVVGVVLGIYLFFKSILRLNYASQRAVRDEMKNYVQSTLKEQTQENNNSEMFNVSDTVNCKNCGSENKLGNKYCSKCGAKLAALICVKCSQKLEGNESFCPKCGFKLV